MIAINNISVSFGADYLFDNISFTINLRDRIGLIGRNGAGKTTLVRILCGLMSPEEGTILKPKDITFGYLPQEVTTTSEKSVYDETKSALKEILELESRIEELNHQKSFRERKIKFSKFQ